MIVWSGRGFLSILILVATLFLCFLVLPDEYSDYGFVITAFVTGIFSWFFGKKWNLQNERIVIDEKTGQKLKIKNNHTLFWIPMQYWGVIFSVLGTIILFQNSILFGVISSIILLVFIAISLLKRTSESKPQKTPNRKLNSTVNEKSTQTRSEISDEEKKRLEIEKERIRKEKEDPSRFMPK
nr:hypothetical protein [uncultured Allomuricauda sp.]